MLSTEGQDGAAAPDNGRPTHQYSMRHAAGTNLQNIFAMPYSPYGQRALRGQDGAAAPAGYTRGSPAKKDQKHVVFQLIDPEDSRFQARLPMRVMISTHDTTESIITTVKNFYGLYECGVSFENREGISIVAGYDNFEKDMTVFVRVVPQPASTHKEPARDSASPKKPSLGAPFMPQPSPGHSPSKNGARSAGVRSMSPQSDIGRRSMSAAPGGKPRPQRTKSKDNSAMGDDAGYSSGDNGGGSVTSSRRSKTELVNAEISVDNIVEGGRRKGAFESSVSPAHLCWLCTSTDHPTATATVRTSQCACQRIYFVGLAAASEWTTALGVSLHEHQPTDLHLPAAPSLSYELRKWLSPSSAQLHQQRVQLSIQSASPAA